MDEQTGVGIVRQCYDAFTAGDMQRLMSFMDPGITWELPDVPGVPFSGKRQGREQVAEFFQMVNEKQAVREFAPQEFVAQGDRVVALGHYAWTVKENGAGFESDWAHIFTVRDGKVTAFREFLDSHEAARAYQGESAAILHGAAQQADAARLSSRPQ
jgi:ketosteroid isomerase-like protein